MIQAFSKDLDPEPGSAQKKRTELQTLFFPRKKLPSLDLLRWSVVLIKDK